MRGSRLAAGMEARRWMAFFSRAAGSGCFARHWSIKIFPAYELKVFKKIIQNIETFAC
jgi:hypothetical protein